VVLTWRSSTTSMLNFTRGTTEGISRRNSVAKGQDLGLRQSMWELWYQSGTGIDISLSISVLPCEFSFIRCSYSFTYHPSDEQRAFL